MIALVERATQQKAFYIGKPQQPIMVAALDKIGLTKDQVVMVGDNLNTDIQAGFNIGMDTLLVLTGYSSAEDVAKVAQQPTYILNSLDEWQ